jgi:hypothetical protein
LSAKDNLKGKRAPKVTTSRLFQTSASTQGDGYTGSITSLESQGEYISSHSSIIVKRIIETPFLECRKVFSLAAQSTVSRGPGITAIVQYPGDHVFQVPQSLDLFRTPALVGLTHVGWRFDGRNEVKDNISQTDEPNDRTGNVPQHVAVQQDRSNEDVD